MHENIQTFYMCIQRTTIKMFASNSWTFRHVLNPAKSVAQHWQTRKNEWRTKDMLGPTSQPQGFRYPLGIKHGNGKSPMNASFTIENRLIVNGPFSIAMFYYRGQIIYG